MKVSLFCVLTFIYTTNIFSRPIFCLIKINGAVEVNDEKSKSGKIIYKRDYINLKEEKSEIVLFHISGKEIILKGKQIIKVKKLIKQYRLKEHYCFSAYELSKLIQQTSYMFNRKNIKGSLTRPFPLALIINNRNRNITFLKREKANYHLEWNWNDRYEIFSKQKIEDWNYIIEFSDLFGNVSINDTIKGQNYFHIDFSDKKYDQIFNQQINNSVVYRLYCENKDLYSGGGNIFKFGVPKCIESIQENRFGKLLFALYLEHKDIKTDLNNIYQQLIKDEKYDSFFRMYYNGFTKREKERRIEFD